MADHGGNGSGGEVIDRPEDRGEPMAVEQDDQTVLEEATSDDAVVKEGGDGGRDQLQESGDGEECRATKAVPRATEETGVMRPSASPLGLSTVAEGSPMVIEGETGDVSGGGAGGDDIGPGQTPPRDSAKGKGAVIEEDTPEISVPYREEDIVFRPTVTAATSSSHVPITKYDVAEHLPDEALVKLLEDNPMIGELVLKAKKDRARAIEASEAAERAERERAGQEGLAADVEAEERATTEAQGPRERAVDEAGAMTRPAFLAKAYVPPVPHLFVPSGFQAHRPQQPEYDADLVLRDPGVHIANTWAEVYSYKKNPFLSFKFIFA
ncbi:hypothetical protein RHMOL_Rhmol09G0124000 [Rhododendron molle]|uniref:Uncharacterized protein n=1 Tax=Rhododendron molle TaxID=49168 RepID=A0ACC0MCI9_RHOML|nr:hypothetical protein RHMOL_Rhmol09G0124000 [Rhododendron molle]